MLGDGGGPGRDGRTRLLAHCSFPSGDRIHLHRLKAPGVLRWTERTRVLGWAGGARVLTWTLRSGRPLRARSGSPHGRSGSKTTGVAPIPGTLSRSSSPKPRRRIRSALIETFVAVQKGLRIHPQASRIGAQKRAHVEGARQRIKPIVFQSMQVLRMDLRLLLHILQRQSHRFSRPPQLSSDLHNSHSSSLPDFNQRQNAAISESSTS